MTGDFAMKIFNADGSEVEMCGNGIRCLANYVWKRGLSQKDPLVIETPAGLISPRREGGLVRVDMGAPILIPADIPVDLSGREPVLDRPLMIDDREFRITCVSMGNPHAVIFLHEDLARFPVSRYGPLIEHHPLFPRRTNVEFVTLDGPRHVTMRVWERGAGETMACGTGASAVGVASMLKGLTERTITVALPGGDLVIEWAGDDHVYMTGPAEEVFEGTVRI
jgi:diaminopimelate epimerase